MILLDAVDLLGFLRDTLPIINSISIVALSLFFVWAFMTRKIVSVVEVDTMRKERDEFKEMAIRGTNQSSQLVDIVRLFAEFQKGK